MDETESSQSPQPEEKPTETLPVEPQPAEPAAAETPVEAPAPSPTPAVEEPVIPPAGPTRAGRFFRMALRWVTFVAVVFALGVLAAYFILYRPLADQANRQQADLAQAQKQLADSQTSLKTASDQVKTLQGQYDQAKTALDQANNQAFLQTVLTDLANARLALANKDGPAARDALTAAQTDLAKLLPAVQQKDSQVADAISGRLTLALNELNRDPRTALSDLDVLNRNLQDLQKLLFP